MHEAQTTLNEQSTDHSQLKDQVLHSMFIGFLKGFVLFISSNVCFYSSAGFLIAKYIDLAYVFSEFPQISFFGPEPTTTFNCI